MNRTREDRIYELQQALSALPPGEWAAYLEVGCADDPSLRNDVMARQREVDRTLLRARARFAVKGMPGSRIRRDSG